MDLIYAVWVNMSQYPDLGQTMEVLLGIIFSALDLEQLPVVSSATADIEMLVLVAQMRHRWLERPYVLFQYVAPVFSLGLIVLLSACTLAVRWMAGLPIWYLLPLPVLILADWMLCLLQRGYVSRSDCLENGAGVHFCTRCAYHVPALAHHCPLCDRCVRLRDHHCFFMSACVGVDNLAHFMAFCLHSCLGSAVAAFCIGWHLHCHHLPLDSMYGAVNFLLPPVAAGSWLLGQLQLSVGVLLVLMYVALSTGMCTAVMLTYHTVMMFSGQIVPNRKEIHSCKKSPYNALQGFRRVFGRLGLLHFIVPYYRIPYNPHLVLNAPTDDIKIVAP